MDQIFIEILVTGKKNVAAGVMKIFFGILALLSFAMMSITLLNIVLAAMFAAAAYFFYLHENIEYEYSYVERELTVDKIMAKSRRKQAGNYLLDKIEMGAPEGSEHLSGFANKKYRTIDYSQKTEQNKFVLYYEGNIKLILENSDKLMKALRTQAPNKIFLD